MILKLILTGGIILVWFYAAIFGLAMEYDPYYFDVTEGSQEEKALNRRVWAIFFRRTAWALVALAIVWFTL